MFEGLAPSWWTIWEESGGVVLLEGVWTKGGIWDFQRFTPFPVFFSSPLCPRWWRCKLSASAPAPCCETFCRACHHCDRELQRSKTLNQINSSQVVFLLVPYHISRKVTQTWPEIYICHFLFIFMKISISTLISVNQNVDQLQNSLNIIYI